MNEEPFQFAVARICQQIGGLGREFEKFREELAGVEIDRAMRVAVGKRGSRRWADYGGR